MARLKFSDKPYYSADQIAASLDPDDIFNCYLDDTPDGLSIRRRPGLVLFADLNTGTQGQGIFYWEAMDKVVAVSNGNTFIIDRLGDSTNITSEPLDVRGTVQFADGSRLDATPVLYMANGVLVYSEEGGNTRAPTDVNTPSTADSVVYLNLRFLANIPDTNQFLFTDTDPGEGVLTPYYWSSSDNPLVAESDGDDILGLWVFLQEIYAWGSKGLEIFQDDGATPFVPVPQAAAHVGLEAKYSVVVADNSIFAVCVIDNTRCVVKMVGRSPQIISGAIENILAGYTNVSDAIGQLISVGGTHIYLLQFPSAGKTWAYNIRSDTWIPWSTWEKEIGEHAQFIGQHVVFVKPWNKHLIMSYTDGKVYELRRSANTDMGNVINTYRRTIWEDHGTGSTKAVTRLRVKIKTGHTVTGAAYLRWADDGAEEWTPYVELPLYPEGKRDFIIDLTQMGMYKSRRYEISITDDADLCVCWVDEEVQFLGA